MFGSMNITKQLEQFQIEVTRWTIAAIAWEIVAALVFFLLLYLTVKAAVRDGINESRMGDRWTRAVEQSREGTDLPDMRADR